MCEVESHACDVTSDAATLTLCVHTRVFPLLFHSLIHRPALLDELSYECVSSSGERDEGQGVVLSEQRVERRWQRVEERRTGEERKGEERRGGENQL